MTNPELDRLSKLFEKFPGIGQRQARRFAYFILTQPESYVATLARSLTNARTQAHTCSRCLRIFEGIPGTCTICSDPARDQSTLIVVEKSPDIEAILRTDYRGLFFVLGGLIPIVQKHVLEGTNINLLTARIQDEQKTLSEIILAFPLTPNGDHTDSVVRETLEPLGTSIRISSLGRGLSAGTELEYADPASLAASLKKRE